MFFTLKKEGVLVAFGFTTVNSLRFTMSILQPLSARSLRMISVQFFPSAPGMKQNAPLPSWIVSNTRKPIPSVWEYETTLKHNPKAVAEAIVSNGNLLKLWHIYDSSHSSSCTLQL